MKKVLFILLLVSQTWAQYIHKPSFGRFSSIKTDQIGIGLATLYGTGTTMAAGVKISQSSYDNDILSFHSSDIAHGITSYRETDLYGAFLKGTPAEGGLQMVGISEGTSNALIFTGVVGSTPAANNWAFKFLGAKKAGAVTTGLGATDNLFGVTNNGTAVMIITGNGNTCFGTDFSPDAKLEVEGGGFLANDSLRVGTGGIWQRNWYYNAADSSIRIVFYNSTLARLDTVKCPQDNEIIFSDGKDTYGMTVNNDKLTFWNDAATPAAKMTIDSTGNVDISGVLTYNYIHAFAEKEDTTITPNCNGNGVYTKISGLFNSTGIIENDGLTLSLGDSITIITPGDYRITYSFTVLGGNAIDWKIAVFKNSVKQYGVRRTTSGVTNYSGGTLPYYLKNLVTGDDISFKVTNLTNPYTDDPTFTNLNIFIEKVPE